MALSRFTIRQLEVLVIAADEQSFTLAAERVGLTAQAVSQLVAELESILGFRLFDRTTRRVSLTSAGRDFLRSAQTVMHHLRAAETAAADIRQRAVGLVRVGAPLVLASTAVPSAIKDYAAIRPRVSVRVRDIPVEALVNAVAEGDVDIAVGPDRPIAAEVQRVELFDSPWVLWCSPHHPLAAMDEVSWEDLRSQPLVAAGRDHELSVAKMRKTLPEDTRITPVDVVVNISTALGIAAQGTAATLAPAYVAALAYRFGLVMRRIVEPAITRKVCLYKPSHRTLSPAGEGFAQHLGTWLPEWSSAMDLDAKDPG